MPRVRPLLLGFGLAVALAACGAGDDDGDAAATTARPETTAQAPQSAPVRTTETEAGASPARPAGTGVRLVRIGSFSSPVYVTSPPGDANRIFVVEQGGVIRVVRNGRSLGTPFLDISGNVTSGGEQGLLSMAFAPDYASSRRFYVYYTDRSGQQVVAEFRARGNDPDRAIRGSERVVMRMSDPEGNHNGGQLQFGPDRLLYIATGDGGGAGDQHGSRGNGQNLASLLGKILRIDPVASGGRAYAVPRSNPFVSRRGARGEIYSYGLRNPWRFSFDRSTGAIAIGDVGQNSFEEIDYLPRGRARGANFGWRPFEGNAPNTDEPAPGHVRPVFTYGRSRGCSITGGYIVRDRALASLFGRYVYGDFCQGQLRSIRLRAGGSSGDRAIPGVPRVENLTSFGQDARGRIYAASQSGPVYRFAPR